jgi:hypothetical protein
MIYATLSPERSFLQPASISCLLLVLGGLGGSAARAQVPAGWRETTAFVAVFAPPPPRAAAYRAYTTPQLLPEVLTQLQSDPGLQRQAGAWQPRALLAADAFGQTGMYDRAALARLYGAQRPLVVRGARTAPDGQLEAWTLVSPHPDEKLQRLQPGTLILVLRVP